MTSLSTICESISSDVAEWSDDDDSCSSKTSLPSSIAGPEVDIGDTKHCDDGWIRFTPESVSALAVDRLIIVQSLRLHGMHYLFALYLS